MTAGIDWMPIWPGMAGCLSMSILTSFTLPFAPFTAFSSTGPSCLHGPHHSAQKSTSTGWRRDSSITSFMKPCVVVSLTRPSAGFAPKSCSDIVFPWPVSAGTLNCPNYMGQGASDCNRSWNPSGGLRHPLDPRRMPRRLQEFDQVIATDGRRQGVDQRVAVDHRVLH